jgi:hypothetical protein
MFMLNATTVLVNGLPIWGSSELLDPYNQTQLDSSLDGWNMSDSWDPPESGGLFGDVKAGLENLDRLQAFIEAFPSILMSFEWIPTLWITYFSTVWSFVWWLSVLDLITGGKIFGS